ncbi:adenylate/guanylate cyclase domain-containing protein [Amycolatopsis sp., V23-08]|uniref:Adenylate/guanylate cyclase domain-containing protein n=1 Tax=Amycolatopsis heterodermiae TaxID=3110235 RepID=A0ABU5R423_9PSEU|nr:adenylate/guanylate cyclase domain-containing protein [Amycolatopsis sp., V23-08]MEA5360590.1 adenylate/guanylate cyclase domain-containing protein [Amycolatopsis sp., V23-08]
MTDSHDGQPDRTRKASRFVDLLRAADRRPGLVRSARAVRRLVPGDRDLGDALSTTAGHPSDRVARLLAEAKAEQPSAMRELGLAAVQVWQAVAQGRETETGETTIVFTDLVGFSSWALDVGDARALELLRAVSTASEATIARHRGRVVKGLGDGLMAAFADPASAVEAAYETCGAVSAIDLGGYRPQLRAGLHTGRPRRVGRDYFGVDVNIAARIMDAAGGGEVLITGDVLAYLDRDRFTVRRRRKFRAKGAPSDLEVFAVVPRYE